MNKVLIVISMMMIALNACASDALKVKSPDHEKLALARSLFQAIFNGTTTEHHKQQAKLLGFTWDATDEYIALIDSQKQGLGDYYFKKKPQTSTFLQAPHRYFDRRTGVIAKKLFLESDAAGLSMNSASRKALDQKGNVFDVAHRSDTFFYAYSDSLMSSHSTYKVLQFHGFSNAKRTSDKGALAEVIVSEGVKNPSQSLPVIVTCLSKYFDHVYHYPDQVKELGGTKNVISRMSNGIKPGSFFHIEINADVRDRLASSKKMRGYFYQCF